MDLGYSYNDLVEDVLFCMNISGLGEWCLCNYINEYYGDVMLEWVLVNLFNILVVKILELVGCDNVCKVVLDFGIESDFVDGLVLVLGVLESFLFEMIGVYVGILNGGLLVMFYGLVELCL